MNELLYLPVAMAEEFRSLLRHMYSGPKALKKPKIVAKDIEVAMVTTHRKYRGLIHNALKRLVTLRAPFLHPPGVPATFASWLADSAKAEVPMGFASKTAGEGSSFQETSCPLTGVQAS